MARILVVDDEIVVCKNVGKILNREGHIVDYALSAQDALENFLEKETYDTVITDLKMPVSLPGMDFLAIVKKRWPDVPVIVITGFATVKSAVQAMRTGAFDYIPKPFTPDELRSVVARALVPGR
jgi:DNA-binding NtrC family response regulator